MSLFTQVDEVRFFSGETGFCWCTNLYFMQTSMNQAYYLFQCKWTDYSCFLKQEKPSTWMYIFHVSCNLVGTYLEVLLLEHSDSCVFGSLPLRHLYIPSHKLKGSSHKPCNGHVWKIQIRLKVLSLWLPTGWKVILLLGWTYWTYRRLSFHYLLDRINVVAREHLT